MKKQINILLFFQLVLVFITPAISYAQEYTLTTTTANTVSSKSLVDLPGLSGNTLAIIIATPLGNTKTMNPHPTGAWYYSGKWNIFNSDHAVMLTGLTYKVQYFLNPGANQFLHLVTQQNLGADGSYIDNPALNNKPNVQFTIFQNHAPDVRAGSVLNAYEAKSGYSVSAGKWFITNVGGQPLYKGSAYNIVISAAETTSGTNPIPIDNSSVQPCKCPASLPPNGQALGDLVGMYPNPMVAKILNRPLSNTPPQIGQILKWNGTEWAPSDDATGSGTGATYTAGTGITLTGSAFSANTDLPMWNAKKLMGRDIYATQPAIGQILKWNGTGWMPSDDNVASTTQTTLPIQSFFKTSVQSPYQIRGNQYSSETYPLAELTQNLTLSKKSRLVISANLQIRTDPCPLNAIGCSNNAYVDLQLIVDNAWVRSWNFHSDQNHFAAPMIFSNFMLDLNPGAHTVEFRLLNLPGSIARVEQNGQTSIMVIPLE